MKTTMRKNVLATTALGAMLAVPGAAIAQETCIQVLGTVDTQAQAADSGQASALIVTNGAAEEGATCIQSLDELAAMLGDGAALAEGLTAIEPAAGTAGGEAEAVPEDVPPEAAEASEEAVPQAEEQAAADAEAPAEDEMAADAEAPTEDEMAADAEAPTEDEMAADAEAPTEGEMAADAEAPTEDEMAADAEAPIEDEMPVDEQVADEQPIGNAAEMLAGLTAGDLVGMDVLSPEGEDIGTVESLAVDTEGRVNVVMSLDDGVLGLGDSERVVAIEQFDYYAEEESLVLVQLSEEWLDTLPEYDSDTPGYTRIEDEAYVFGG